MTGNETYKRYDRMVGTQIDESYVIVDIETTKYYAFNRSAKDIWDLLAEPVSIEDIVNELTQRYDVAVEVSRQSVHGVIEALKAKGLVAVV